MRTSRSVGPDLGGSTSRVTVVAPAFSLLLLFACGSEVTIEDRVSDFLLKRGWYEVDGSRIALETAPDVEVLACRSTGDASYSCDIDFNDELADSIERGLAVMGAGPESSHSAVLRTICLSVEGAEIREVAC